MSDHESATAPAASGWGPMFREVLPLVRPYWLRELEVLILMLLSVGVGLVVPLSGKYLIDSVIAEQSRRHLGYLVIALFVVYIAGALIDLRRAYAMGWVNERIQMDLQLRVFTAMQRLPMGFHTRARVGDLMARLSNDLEAVNMALTTLFGQGIFLLMSVIAAAVTLIVLSPLLGAVLIVMLPIFLVSHRLLMRRFQEASYRYQSHVGESLAVAQEHLSAQPVIKAYGLETHAVTGFRQRLGDAFAAFTNLLTIAAAFQASIRFAITLGELLVLGMGGYLVLEGRMTVGTLLAAMALLPALIQPIASLSGVGQTVHQATGAFARVREVLDEPEEPIGQSLVPPLERELRFDRVSFGYDDDRPTVRDLNLTIPAGSNVAIVGPSGAGKSTIVNLLLRFWEPQQGAVRFDDHDLRAGSMASLRNQIGVVFQETFLFGGSIRDNIAIGRLDATDAEIRAAAQAARLDTWIASLPDGYDSQIGERGVRMSGGQRQRLALARALLRDPAILLLDEATSALDPATEAAILETLADVSHGRTTITITHRLTSVTSADRIFVLNEGRLEEEGTHRELMQANGLYRSLFEEQTRSEPEVVVGAAYITDTNSPASVR